MNFCGISRPRVCIAEVVKKALSSKDFFELGIKIKLVLIQKMNNKHICPLFNSFFIIIPNVMNLWGFFSRPTVYIAEVIKAA